MKKSPPGTAVNREEILHIFSELDALLKTQARKLSVTVIGGVSIMLLGIRERSTRDIDIANGPDAAAFQKICAERHVPVDIVTIASTVDLLHAQKVVLFHGEALTVESVTAEDLIKLKLERYRKQDPEDIDAIIKKTELPYEQYKALVLDMLPDYIGNPRELMLSALMVVERMYPEQREDFKTVLES